ncbi:MAG: PTS sugar transporter subunit IIA [Opitutae bacterium]|nr:PTS sugar transporter subunit IIA [Opitutae bacterium]
MPGPISRLLDPSRIVLRVQNTRRTAALNEVARVLVGHPDVANFDGFYHELLARDRLDTTCLGNGIALPHARTEHVKAIVMAVGRSDSGILFENGNETVRLMFMLGTPKSKPGDYLQVVSALCKLLKSPANREAFLAAATPEEFIRTVVAAEEKLLASV